MDNWVFPLFWIGFPPSLYAEGTPEIELLDNDGAFLLDNDDAQLLDNS